MAKNETNLGNDGLDAGGKLTDLSKRKIAFKEAAAQRGLKRERGKGADANPIITNAFHSAAKRFKKMLPKE